MVNKQFAWQPYGAEMRAEMPDRVTVGVSPDRVTGVLGNTPKRGTTWRAWASQWDGVSTVSRYGRDEYAVQHKTRAEAMRAAEAIYSDARDKQ